MIMDKAHILPDGVGACELKIPVGTLGTRQTDGAEPGAQSKGRRRSEPSLHFAAVRIHDDQLCL